MKNKTLDLQSMNYIENIQNIQNINKENCDSFRNILRDALIRWDIEELLTYYMKCINDKTLDDRYIGMLGFLLFTVSVDQSSSKLPGELSQTVRLSDDDKRKENRAIEIRDNVLKNLSLYRFIIDEYQIDLDRSEEPIDLTFHTTGTTSYILKIKFAEKFNGKVIVLKILKYKYFDNQTINNKTENYQSNYQDNEFSPYIYKSGPRYILMDYILGPTLQEYMHASFINEKNKEKVISRIICELCCKLNYFARDHGIIHCDLNTNNIILNNIQYNNEDGQISFKVYLIDFGVNYLLNEKIGSSRALTKAGIYIPEEVLVDLNNASIMSDIYSLGVILLEMLQILHECGETIEMEHEFEYRKFDEYLDNVRIKHPILASILDDILDRDPNLRLFDLQQKYKIQNKYDDKIFDNENLFRNFKRQTVHEQQLINKSFSHIYIDLQSNINLEFELHEIERKRKKDFWFRFLQNFLAFLKGSFSSIIGQNFQKVQYFMKIDDLPKQGEVNFRIISKNLGIWAFTAEISHILVSAGFALIIINYFNNKIPSFPPLINLHFDLTGLLSAFVLFSFSAIAAEYYQNIFSSIYSKSLEKKGLWNHMWIRFCTFYWPIPILIAYFHNIHWWAYVAALGTFIISINNFLNYQLAKKAKSVIQTTFKNIPSQSLNDRLKEFKEWWTLMLAYSLGLLTIGICLNIGLIKDEIAYLIITLIINIKMWLYNCTENAFNVNKTLQFLYTRYNRALKYSKMKLLA